jgi:hypothetical protein
MKFKTALTDRHGKRRDFLRGGRPKPSPAAAQARAVDAQPYRVMGRFSSMVYWSLLKRFTMRPWPGAKQHQDTNPSCEAAHRHYKV